MKRTPKLLSANGALPHLQGGLVDSSRLSLNELYQGNTPHPHAWSEGPAKVDHSNFCVLFNDSYVWCAATLLQVFLLVLTASLPPGGDRLEDVRRVSLSMGRPKNRRPLNRTQTCAFQGVLVYSQASINGLYKLEYVCCKVCLPKNFLIVVTSLKFCIWWFKFSKIWKSR